MQLTKKFWSSADFGGIHLTFERLKNFFREDTSEIIGAYFDGEKIFIARLTEKIETIELDADGTELEQLAEKISLACTQRAWKISSVGLCLREGEVVTYQTEVAKIPEKEIPSLVKSWSTAQPGNDKAFSFARVGEEIWMETLPRARVEEFAAAFKKFNMNLRGLSLMPTNLLDKISPFDRAKFIAEVVRDKKNPNLLSARGSVWSWKKISLATAAIFFIVMIFGSAKVFLDYRTASEKLDAAKISIDELREDLALKETLDANISELQRLNKIAAQLSGKENFNLLINLGRIAGEEVRLTKIRVEENILEVEGLTDNPAAVRNYLARVKNFVVKSARLESSSENDEGKIVFVIRGAL